MCQRIIRFLNIDGVRIHAVEQGQGPLVLMLHGFPESWYSWRHQLDGLARAGYRAVAIDQRGFGQSSKFWATEQYRIDRLVEDAAGVVAALGEQQAVVIGHDWGAPIAWTSAWLRPEVFRGVIGISVPFSGRSLIALPGNPFGEAASPDRYHEIVAGPGQDFYQTYFGARGAVVREFERDIRGNLRALIYMISGDAPEPVRQMIAGQTTVEAVRNGGFCVPHGGGFADAFIKPERMPDWFNEADVDFLAAEFERSGFSGPLSYYANIDASWQVLAPQAGKPLTVPALFIGGEFDIATAWGREAIERAHEHIPDYRGSIIVQGSGHWIQQERPAETNAAIIDFLKGLA